MFVIFVLLPEIIFWGFDNVLCSCRWCDVIRYGSMFLVFEVFLFLSFPDLFCSRKSNENKEQEYGTKSKTNQWSPIINKKENNKPSTREPRTKKIAHSITKTIKQKQHIKNKYNIKRFLIILLVFCAWFVSWGCVYFLLMLHLTLFFYQKPQHET